MRKRLHIATLAITILLAGYGHAALGQSNAPTVDCSLDGHAYTCSRADLLRAFAEAHTLALESQPKDRIADGQLASFATSLAKQVAAPQAAADMTLRLVRNQPSGVAVGPGDMDLATLRVFSTKAGGAANHLLWVETYRGQPDIPWPAVVRALTHQLQATLAGH